MIIDFHTHLGNIRQGSAPIELWQQTPPPHYLMISSRSVEAPDNLFYRKQMPVMSAVFLKHALLTLLRQRQTWKGMTIPNLLEDMGHHRIEYSVVLPIDYLDNREPSKQLLAACAHTSEVIPFCSVHPHDPERIRKLRTSVELGAKGVKLHPNFQQFRPDDADVSDVYRFCNDNHVPLILHSGVTGRERTLWWRKTLSSMEYISVIPRNFPDLVLILAHAGIAQYEQAIALAQSARHVYLEISGQPADHIRQALCAVGAERVLFGSDWPFWNQALALKAVRQATQGDVPAARCILYENAAYLLQLGEKQNDEYRTS